MQIEYRDFNNAEIVLSNKWSQEWSELEQVLKQLPMHFKASDQAGKIGDIIFNPVGTNKWIKDNLENRHWGANLPIPDELDFLGKDVDFGKNGIIAEVQFSNYPFLLNNLLRSELFFKGKVNLTKQAPDALIVVTKAGRFPASNSTLYYAQAIKQTSILCQKGVIEIPIRIVGLFADTGLDVCATWTEYTDKRYSRTIASETTERFSIVDNPKLASYRIARIS
jgi:hypothetical protein